MQTEVKQWRSSIYLHRGTDIWREKYDKRQPTVFADSSYSGLPIEQWMTAIQWLDVCKERNFRNELIPHQNESGSNFTTSLF